MSETRTTQHPGPTGDQQVPAADWESLYPADPEIMVSIEGDKRGLADVKRKAQERIDRIRSRS